MLLLLVMATIQTHILENMLTCSNIELSQLEPGDHIFRFGAVFKKSILTHHGIYVNDNKVIHFSGGEGNTNNLGNDILDAKITLTTITGFMSNKVKCYRMNENYSVIKRDEIISRAYSELGSKFGGYNIVNNNCEHFSNWCRTGNRFSYQTDLISKVSKYILKSLGVKDEKLKNINMAVSDAKELIKPLEQLSTDVVLTSSILDVIKMFL